ncbi:hypothetical protein HY994_05190 [Candidatus Micrarchaeota archaeon]|nr:hypothetical protein [Candidatus Micrarchaeota archaeon]
MPERTQSKGVAEGSAASIFFLFPRFFQTSFTLFRKRLRHFLKSLGRVSVPDIFFSIFSVILLGPAEHRYIGVNRTRSAGSQSEPPPKPLKSPKPTDKPMRIEQLEKLLQRKSRVRSSMRIINN